MHQLGEHAALVFRDDAVADARQHHVLAVGRRALKGEEHDGDETDPHDRAEVAVDIGLIDDLADQPGGSAVQAAATAIIRKTRA